MDSNRGEATGTPAREPHGATMPDKQPNIVFLLRDNVGWGDFACYGGNTPTPRICGKEEM